MNDEKPANLSVGSIIGRYRIVKKIGAGGMGEVYLAEDSRLRRSVALKVLPENIALDKERLRRFEQEAFAASALNHPNILTIYEFGEESGTHFLATEYVDGETLREKLNSDELSLTDALGIAEQTAFALSAAHASGIVHRDLKPENIMIRRDRIVKILDFGLAKLIEKKDANLDMEAETRALVKTNPGVVMGTVAYMSPEQARGKDTDERTDIWSLGVLIYEMVTRHLPFSGETTNDTIAAILTQDPPLVSRYIDDAPPELQRIVGRILRKNRDERYQHVKDLWIDLKDLRQELEFAAKLEHSVTPNKSVRKEIEIDADTQILTVGKPTDTEASVGSTKDSATGGTRPTSSAEYIIGGVKRHKAGAMIVLAILVAAVSGIGFGIYQLTSKNPSKTAAAAVSFQSAKLTRLTSTGKVIGVSISPDGKYVAHVMEDAGQQSLWIRQTATTSNVQIVPPSDVVYRGLAFSPDGNYVYYSVREKNDLSGMLYQVPSLGGTSRKLLTGIANSLAFSPDGKQMAFFRTSLVEGAREDALMIANADGTGQRVLATRHANERFHRGAFSSLSWSPDGQTIISPVGNLAENNMTIATVSTKTGEIKMLTPQRWFAVRQAAWLADGGSILFNAQDSSELTFQIWQFFFATGEVKRVTNDLIDYRMFSLTANSDALAVIQGEGTANIWALPTGDTSRAAQITSDRNFNRDLAWTPDGRIIYASNANKGLNVYLTDLSGSSPKQLTDTFGANRYPTVTRDGRYIVFMSDRTGRPHIWRMDLDGGNPRQLTDGFDLYPSVSPDGQWIFYQSWTGKTTLRKVSIEGGAPIELTDYIAGRPAISPDGKQIACAYQENLGAPVKLAILSSEGGTPLKTFQAALDPEINVRWTMDGKEIVFSATEKGVSNLWAQPVDGGKPRQLTNFKSDRIFWFDFSHDGKQLALSRGMTLGDVVLIKDF